MPKSYRTRIQDVCIDLKQISKQNTNTQVSKKGKIVMTLYSRTFLREINPKVLFQYKYCHKEHSTITPFTFTNTFFTYVGPISIFLCLFIPHHRSPLSNDTISTNFLLVIKSSRSYNTITYFVNYDKILALFFCPIVFIFCLY